MAQIKRIDGCSPCFQVFSGKQWMVVVQWTLLQILLLAALVVPSRYSRNSPFHYLYAVLFNYYSKLR